MGGCSVSSLAQRTFSASCPSGRGAWKVTNGVLAGTDASKPFKALQGHGLPACEDWMRGPPYPAATRRGLCMGLGQSQPGRWPPAGCGGVGEPKRREGRHQAFSFERGLEGLGLRFHQGLLLSETGQGVPRGRWWCLMEGENRKGKPCP